MQEKLNIRIPDMIMCLSKAIDLVSPLVADHHKRVAYIASSIAAEMGLSKEEQNDLIIAGSVHDAGALSLKDRLDTLNFEIKSPQSHAELGYLLIRKFEPFSKIAPMVRYHHVPWNYGKGAELKGETVPVGSHILHLADRVSVLIKRQKAVVGQVQGICEKIEGASGKMFMPDLVDAFKKLSERESFWFDAVSPEVSSVLEREARLGTIELDMDGLLELGRLFSRIIDFRSRFTAVHSSGVAVCAEALACLAGMSAQECRMMRLAGYLHDLGKLAVPAEILEKPARLTKSEFNTIKSHTFYTFRILENIGSLDVVNTWASFHHERLDGKGYPFHRKELSLGSMIMAVADVFTAITEDRPYRKGMPYNEALQVLKGMASSSQLNEDLVLILSRHYDEMNSIRSSAQKEASEEYRKFR